MRWKSFSKICLLSSFLCLLFSLPAVAQSRIEDVELTIPATTLTIQGYAAPDAVVTFREDESVIGTTTATTSGYYTKVFSSSIGLRTINAYFTDTTGKQSKIVSFSVSVAAQQDTTVTAHLPPTVALQSSGTILQGSIVQINGYTAANSSVTLSISLGAPGATVFSNSSGFYEFLYESEQLSSDSYQAVVTSEKSATQSSTPVTFQIVEQNGPTRPDFVVRPEQLPPPTPLSPEDGATINGSSAQISGESVPGAQINIYENGTLYGSIFADSRGKWSFVYEARFSPVLLSFEACIDGTCSVLSKNIKLFFDGIVTQCADVLFELAQYRFWDIKTNEEVPSDVFLSSGDGLLRINWGDDSAEERFNHDADRPQTYLRSYDKSGNYNATAKLIQDDCEVTRYFSVQVRDEPSSPIYWLFIVLIPVACMYVGNRLYRSTSEDDTIELKDK